jgi:DNA replication protein DnaC
MNKLEIYCKKLKLGSEILEEFEEIEFINKKDYLTKVLEKSCSYSEIRRKNRRIKDAKFDLVKTFESYEFKELELPLTLTEESIKKCEFLEKNENLIFYGPSGRGKTHLAIAIGIQACDLGKKVRFYKVSHLINDLVEAKESGLLAKFLKNLKKFDLIILDELGYVPLGERGAELFFQVIADCYEKKSLIVTTNIEFSNWIGIFMDKKITSAIIDRIVHHGHLIMFNGSNWRVENSLSLLK